MPRQVNTLEPASSIVSVFGGCRALAAALKLCPSTVSRWSTSYDKRGTHGKIPQKYWSSIIENAQTQGKTITPADLAGLK